MTVSGGVKSAKIIDASCTYNSDGTFSISNGTWPLNGSTPDDKMCHGSFYGTDADSIGGAWGMDKGSEGAVGIFEGEKDPV